MDLLCISCLGKPSECYCTRPRPAKEDEVKFDHAGYVALQEKEFYDSISEPDWATDP